MYAWDDEMDQYLIQSQSQPHSFHRDSSVASGSALSAFPLTPSTAAAQTGQSGQFDFDYEQSMEYDDMQPQIGEDRMLGGREDGIGRRDRPERKKKPARPLVSKFLKSIYANSFSRRARIMVLDFDTRNFSRN